MRYRIRGRDKASQSPVELFFLDAADEEEARNKASELGAVVDRVEGAPQKDEAIQPRAERATPPQPAASMPVTDNRPSASTALPWTRRRWLLLCLVLFLASLAGGIWIGIACPRLLPLGLGTPTPSAGIRLEELQSAEPSAGIRLEELKSAEELFALAGQEAVVVKYSGGDVEFWVEIESQGKKEKIGPVRALHGLLGDQEKLPSPNQIVEGYLLWLRGDADETGREAWRLACRRDLVGTERSGLQVSTPLAEANVSRSREDK